LADKFLCMTSALTELRTSIPVANVSMVDDMHDFVNRYAELINEIAWMNGTTNILPSSELEYFLNGVEYIFSLLHACKIQIAVRQNGDDAEINSMLNEVSDVLHSDLDQLITRYDGTERKGVSLSG
jgi:hypothetical protein